MRSRLSLVCVWLVVYISVVVIVMFVMMFMLLMWGIVFVWNFCGFEKLWFEDKWLCFVDECMINSVIVVVMKKVVNKYNMVVSIGCGFKWIYCLVFGFLFFECFKNYNLECVL